MNWADANAACAKLGSGWHLPTMIELDILYLNRESIGGFSTVSYWSSMEHNDGCIDDAWILNFATRSQVSFPKTNVSYVRAVRNF
jgi:hypothetical protein